MDEDLKPSFSLPPELDAYARNFALQAALKALQSMMYHPVQPIDAATASATLAVLGRQFEEAKTPEEARKLICQYLWGLRQLIWPSVRPEACVVIARMIEMFVDLNNGVVPMALLPSTKKTEAGGNTPGSKRAPLDHRYGAAVACAALDAMMEADVSEEEAYKLVANAVGIRRDRTAKQRKTSLRNWRYKVTSGIFDEGPKRIYGQTKAAILEVVRSTGEGAAVSSDIAKKLALHILEGEFQKLRNSPFPK